LIPCGLSGAVTPSMGRQKQKRRGSFSILAFLFASRYQLAVVSFSTPRRI
jgi:hypothetical protein